MTARPASGRATYELHEAMFRLPKMPWPKLTAQQRRDWAAFEQAITPADGGRLTLTLAELAALSKAATHITGTRSGVGCQDAAAVGEFTPAEVADLAAAQARISVYATHRQQAAPASPKGVQQ